MDIEITLRRRQDSPWRAQALIESEHYKAGRINADEYLFILGAHKRALIKRNIIDLDFWVWREAEERKLALDKLTKIE